ncbi:MAG: hypothetical protein HKN79_07795, partial [Flavobacteriales bacterium]|nr:hypothetical protein [Flavobacteriales bacterium]
MMLRYAPLALLLLIACLSPEDVEKGDVSTKASDSEHIPNRHADVVFYNVENLFDVKDHPRKDDNDFTPNGRNEWSQGRYEKKIQNLGRVIQSMDHGDGLPVLIGLAEVENEDVVEDLGEFIASGSYGVVHHESQDRRGIDLALLYDRSRFELLDDEAEPISFSQNGYTSRDILHVHGRLDGEEVHLYLNHWPSRREGRSETEHRRLDAARTLKMMVDQVKDSESSVIILGDFNDYPDNRSMTEVLDARPSDSPESSELINLAYAPHMADKGTYPYKGDWGMLDQAIVSDDLMDGKGLELTQEGLEIHWREFFLFYDKKYKEFKPNRTYGGPRYYGGYSDHLPI